MGIERFSGLQRLRGAGDRGSRREGETVRLRVVNRGRVKHELVLGMRGTVRVEPRERRST